MYCSIGFSSFSYSHLHVVLMLYISKMEGELLPREGNKLKWINKSELKSLKMPEGIKPIPFILDII